MNKRRRLRNHKAAVNVFVALSAFALAGCSGGENASTEGPDTAPVAEAPAAPTPDAPALQAIWSSAPLDDRVSGLSVLPGERGLAALGRDGAVQLFDLDLERQSDRVPLGLSAIANGVPFGDGVILIPALDADGRIKAAVAAGGVLSGSLLDLSNESADRLCTLTGGDGPVLAVRRNGTFSFYSVAEAAGEPVLEVAETPTDSELTTCPSDEGNALNATESGIERSGRTVPVQTGLSVMMPRSIDAIAATSRAVSGTYAGGLVALAGPDADRNGAYRIILLAADELTGRGRSALEADLSRLPARPD